MDIDNDGIAAGHPQQVDRPRFVASSSNSEFNTIEPRLTTVGCSMYPDHMFEFDSSFILPEAKASFTKLVKLVSSKPDCPLSIFGHADPVGRDSYNKKLSGRRAMAVYAVLIRDTEIWEKLYSNNIGGVGDKWGIKTTQQILEILGFPPGEITGSMNPETEQAVYDFQDKYDLGYDGDPGPETRGCLYEKYMDYLCKGGQGQPFRMEKKDFLAQGEGKDQKGSCQGCGEFNPMFIMSEEVWDDLKKKVNHDIRNKVNEPNRRVVVFLFAKGTVVNPKYWPCPSVEESGSACKKRFWSDGKDRRSKREKDQPRKFQETEDTFGCRFYHGLAQYSPCEAILDLWVIRLLVDGPHKEKIPLSRRRFVLKAGSTDNAPTLRGITDVNGILRIPVLDEHVTMTMKLDVSCYLSNKEADNNNPNNNSAQSGQSQQDPCSKKESVPPEKGWKDEDQFLPFTLECGDLLPMGVQKFLPENQRLYNLGYGSENPTEWDRQTRDLAIKSFKVDHDLGNDSNMPPEISQAIKREHGG